MHYFITSSKTSYITENSPSHIKQYKDSVTKNYGGDEILELRKEFVNSYSTSSHNTSRVLMKFDYSDISSSIVNGYITNPKYFLRLYEVEGQKEIDNSYTVKAYPLSQSWEQGTGKKYDDPKVKLGVTWTDYDSGSSWPMSLGVNADTGSRIAGGGVWMTGSGYEASQSFDNESADINMDVTDIINNHLGGSNQIDNNGIILKFNETTEDDTTSHNLKFFSKQTHTIYQPKLEVKWDDSSYPNPMATTLTYITMSGEIKNHIFIKGLQETYRESEKVRFRVGCRREFVQKTFTESVLTSSFFIPKGSGSYSMIDINTNTDIIPFSNYTTMSADANSMYFDQWLNTFEPGRFYKVLFKLKYDDGQEVIIDNNEEFKII